MTPSEQIHMEFGNAIRDERIRQNLTVDDVAERLRASTEHILAVENGNPKAFPSETYFQLFAKSYARELGIDYARTLDAMTGQEEIAADEEPPENSEQPAIMHNRPIARSHNPLTIFQRPGMLFGLLAIITAGLLGIAKLVRNNNQATGEGKTISAGMENTFDSGRIAVAPDTSFVMILRMTTTDSTFARVLADGDTIVAESLKAGKTISAAAKKEIIIFAQNPGAVACSINGHRALYDSLSTLSSDFVINPENIHSMLEIRRSPFAPADIKTQSLNNSTDSAKKPTGGNR